MLGAIVPLALVASAFGAVVPGTLAGATVRVRAASGPSPADPNALGNYSPYHKAPVPAGVSETLPADCTVNQVIHLGRHGSRYPSEGGEFELVSALSAKLAAHASDLANAALPAEFQFLKNGYTTSLVHDNLTAIGRQQLFDHGVAFKLRYPNLNASTILASGEDRVVESAQWFGAGYFGCTFDPSSVAVLPENNVTISYFTPQETCPNWPGVTFLSPYSAVSIPPILQRLNAAVPGVNFSATDVLGGFLDCPFDLAEKGAGNAPWCNVFTKDEWAIYEMNVDISWDLSYSYALPNDMGRLLGALYVQKLLDRLQHPTQPVTLEFSHDDTIILALTAMDLIKDSPPLNVSGPIRPNRKLRTSNLVPFAAQMTWEKFSCTKSFKGDQVRLVLNDSPYPLTTCTTVATKKYGSCSVADFVKANSYSTSVAWGDKTWNATCGNPGF